MSTLPQDFKELLEEFASDSVECVLVGGYAVAFHGRPRATKDIDLVLRGTPDNLSRAATALARYGAPSHVVDAIRTMGENDIVFVGSPPLRIDFLRSIDGVEEEKLFEDAVKSQIDGVSVSVVSLENLIANKRAAGRPQDLIDVKLLEQVGKARLGP